MRIEYQLQSLPHFTGEDNLLIDANNGNFIDYNQDILDLQLVEVEGMV